MPFTALYDHFTGNNIVRVNEEYANALLKIIDEHSDLKIDWEVNLFINGKRGGYAIHLKKENSVGAFGFNENKYVLSMNKEEFDFLQRKVRKHKIESLEN